ncbi:PilW family protein [Pseudomethylobacillus aquaticus]|nr:type II secretion system protein [Pseudomethylobacillus aquaticus]
MRRTEEMPNARLLRSSGDAPSVRSSAEPKAEPAMHGFTLIELVVVMSIIGIIAGALTIFIRNPLQTYFDGAARAELGDQADTALRRMAREIRNALPNSLRVAVSGSDMLVEFVPILTAGRYRAEVGTDPADNPLDFSASADSFDVLGPAVTVSAGDKLVINNLGIAGADVYAGSNRRDLTVTGTLSQLAYTGGAFPFSSISSRFYVVGEAVSYACDLASGTLWRYRYAIQASQPASVAALNALASPQALATGLAGCSVSYAAGIQQRNGLITLHLQLQRATARVSLMHQINVVNTP